MTTLKQLIQMVEHVQQTVATQLAPLPLDELNFKTSPNSWSILECLEHLNRYSRYYNPALAKAIEQNSGEGAAMPDISYSWMGKKTLEMVGPQNTKKHKTLKHLNPINSALGRATVEEFLQHQTALLHLLHRAANANLHRKAVPVEFFRLLKLRIGEALEIVVLHEERHVQQALRVKEQLLKQAVA